MATEVPSPIVFVTLDIYSERSHCAVSDQVERAVHLTDSEDAIDWGDLCVAVESFVDGFGIESYELHESCRWSPDGLYMIPLRFECEQYGSCYVRASRARMHVYSLDVVDGDERHVVGPVLQTFRCSESLVPFWNELCDFTASFCTFMGEGDPQYGGERIFHPDGKYNHEQKCWVPLVILGSKKVLRVRCRILGADWKE